MENMTDIEAAKILRQLTAAGQGIYMFPKKGELTQAFARAIEKLEETNAVEPETQTKPAATFGTTGAEFPDIQAVLQGILRDQVMIKRALFGPEYITYTKDLRNDYKENEEMYRREYLGIFSPETMKANDAELLKREQTDDYRPRHSIRLNDNSIERFRQSGRCPQLMEEIGTQYSNRIREQKTEEERLAKMNIIRAYQITEAAWNEYCNYIGSPLRDTPKEGATNESV